MRTLILLLTLLLTNVALGKEYKECLISGNKDKCLSYIKRVCSNRATSRKCAQDANYLFNNHLLELHDATIPPIMLSYVCGNLSTRSYLSSFCYRTASILAGLEMVRTYANTKSFKKARAAGRASYLTYIAEVSKGLNAYAYKKLVADDSDMWRLMGRAISKGMSLIDKSARYYGTI